MSKNEKGYDPEQLIGTGPSSPVNRAKDHVRVYPSDEARKNIIRYTSQLYSSEIRPGDEKGPAHVSFSQKEFKDKFGFGPKFLLEDK